MLGRDWVGAAREGVASVLEWDLETELAWELA